MASLHITVEQFESIASKFGIRPCVAKEIWQRMEEMDNYNTQMAQAEWQFYVRDNPNWLDDLLTAMIEQSGEGHPHG